MDYHGRREAFGMGYKWEGGGNGTGKAFGWEEVVAVVAWVTVGEEDFPNSTYSTVSFSYMNVI